jgi:PAS domain S-box-containing protein
VPHDDAEFASARLAAIVEFSDDAIVSKTLDGVITSWNRAAERMFGWTAAEAVGRHITLIIPKDRYAEEDEVLTRLRRGERIEHFETVRVRKDGTLIDISLTVSPVLNASGAVVGASKIARDISGQKESERVRVVLLAREQEARAAAEAANQLKDDFLAVLSHELRTPLNTAMGWVRLIEAGQLGPEESHKGISAVRRSLDQQLRLINDLLDLTSMVAGKTQIVPQYLDLCELVRLEAEVWRATAFAAKSYRRKLWMREKGDVPFLGMLSSQTPKPRWQPGERYATHVGGYHCEGGDAGGCGGGGRRHPR